MSAFILMVPLAGWAAPAMTSLLPGAHAIVVGDANVGLAGRFGGFEVRDSIAIVSAVGLRYAFLFRKPLAEDSIAAQALATGTGVLNIAACRVGTGADKAQDGRWPTNLVFIHGSDCGVGVSASIECAPGCPVKRLDAQSGDRKAGGSITTSKQGPAAGSYHGQGSGAKGWEGYADEGGAARFFPQFRDDHELRIWLELLISPIGVASAGS